MRKERSKSKSEVIRCSSSFKMGRRQRETTLSLLMVMASVLAPISGVKSVVRTQIFPDYPKPEFIGLNGAGGFIKREDIPPNNPQSLLDSMNFVFGKNTFFGFSPTSDGLTHRCSSLTVGNDVVDQLGDCQCLYLRGNSRPLRHQREWLETVSGEGHDVSMHGPHRRNIRPCQAE